MCLNYCKDATEKIQTRLASESIQFYKCYKVGFGGDTRTLLAPYQNTEGKPSEGFITSNRADSKLTTTESERRQVEQGIHVYREEHSARAAIQSTEHFVIAVSVLAEDFVACDTEQNHCVFHKVAVDEAELSRLMSSAQEEQDDDDEDDDDDDECIYCGDPYCNGECDDDDEDDYDDDDEDDEEDWDDDDWEDDDDDWEDDDEDDDDDDDDD